MDYTPEPPPMQVKSLPRVAPAVVLAAALLTGCSTKAPPPVAKKEFVGVVITVGCDRPDAARAFGPRAALWANRTGAEVKWVPAAEADVLLVPFRDLGRLDPPAALLPVPAALTGDKSAFQWGDLIGTYQRRLTAWGEEPYLVPLTGDGFVLAYRTDVFDDKSFVEAFREKHARHPLPIQTWDQLATVGEFATARRSKPSLAPVPADPTAATTAFAQIAACYDRAASTGKAESPTDPDPYTRGLSFFLEADAVREGGTGKETRLTAPAFGAAFSWFEKTAKSRPADPGDPADALAKGDAVAAVLSLADLKRATKGGAKLGVLPVPGSNAYFDKAGGRKESVGDNHIPYHPASGLGGGVKKSAANPEACWALLAELGGPAGSAATLDDATLGAGPLRREHAADDDRPWQQYGADAAAVHAGLKQHVNPATVNPAAGLRTADAAAVDAILAAEVQAVGTSKKAAADGQAAAAAKWDELDMQTPAEQRRRDRRKSLGVE